MKMTELKEKKLYPSLPDVRENPSAPAIDDLGQSHRLKVITDVLNFLEEESVKREAFSKKYFRVAKYLSAVDSILMGGTVCTEVVAAIFVNQWHRISRGIGVRNWWRRSRGVFIIR